MHRMNNIPVIWYVCIIHRHEGCSRFHYISPTSLPTTRRQNPLDSYFHSHNRVTSRPRKHVRKVTISLIGFNLIQRTNLQRDSKGWTQFRTSIFLNCTWYMNYLQNI